MPHTAEATDPNWPRGLRDLSPAPATMRVWGALPPEASPCLAIVGTRHADEDACDFARSLAKAAAERGVVVISGGAYGIDAAAHEGALLGGGATVVILAGGLGMPYPPGNGPLFEKVAAAGGAVVSFVDDDEVPHPGRFLQRNAFIAAWAEQTVVVQAPVRSGALSTAKHARALGRTLWAVPGAPWDPRAAGTLALLRRGARCAGSVSDIFPSQAAEKTTTTPAPADLDSETRRILALLGPRPRHVDDLAEGVHLPAHTVQVALLTLCLRGLAKERGPGRYVRG